MKQSISLSLGILFLTLSAFIFTGKVQATISPCSPSAPQPCQCFGVDGALGITDWPGGSVTISCAGNLTPPVPACVGSSTTLNIDPAASVSQTFTLQNCNCYSSQCISVTANPDPAPATGSCTIGTYASCGSNGQVITPSIGIECPAPPAPGGGPICIPNGSCNGPTPACGQTSSGIDNCGNTCTLTGPACPTPTTTPPPPPGVSCSSCSTSASVSSSTVNTQVNQMCGSAAGVKWFLDGYQIGGVGGQTATFSNISNGTHTTYGQEVDSSGNTVITCSTANFTVGGPSPTPTSSCPSTPGNKGLDSTCTNSCECSSGLVCRGSPLKCQPSTAVNTCSTFKPSISGPSGLVAPTPNITCPWGTSPDGNGVYWCYPSYACSGEAGIPLTFNIPDDGYNCGGRRAHIYFCDGSGGNCFEAGSTTGSPGPWQVFSAGSQYTWRFIACNSQLLQPGLHSWYAYVTCDNNYVQPCNSDKAYFSTCDSTCPSSSSVACGTTVLNGCNQSCGSVGTYCAGGTTCTNSGGSYVCASPPQPFTQYAPVPTCNGTTAANILSWGASSSNPSPSYDIYRYLSSWSKIGSTTALTYIDPTNNDSGVSAPADLTPYSYFIRAINSVGSADSTPQPVTAQSCQIKAWIQTTGGDVHEN